MGLLGHVPADDQGEKSMEPTVNTVDEQVSRCVERKEQLAALRTELRLAREAGLRARQARRLRQAAARREPQDR